MLTADSKSQESASEKASGVGVIYTPGLDPWIRSGVDLIDVIEVEPQTHWYRSFNRNNDQVNYKLDERAFATLADLNLPTVFHSVGLPIAGHELNLEGQTDALLSSIDRLKPVWFSEHLNFNHVPKPYDYYTNFLLPPLQSEVAVSAIVDNINTLKTLTGLPFLFEIGANYLSPREDEIPDGQFFSLIAEYADCDILLDLHNVWTNAQNGRESIEQLMNELPLDRVKEIHLAAGRSHKGYWIDAHSGLVQNELWEIAFDVVPHLSNLDLITFEMVPEYIQADNIKERDFLEQLQGMQKLWSEKGVDHSELDCDRSRAKHSVKPELASDDHNSVLRWQHELGSLVTQNADTNNPQPDLAHDKGVEIYQDLIRSVRGGLLISALPLTTRYMRTSFGEKYFASVLDKFWKAHTPHPFGSEEALSFVRYLDRNIKSSSEQSAQLMSIVQYETALINAATSDDQVQIDLDDKTAQLIAQLSEGKSSSARQSA